MTDRWHYLPLDMYSEIAQTWDVPENLARIGHYLNVGRVPLSGVEAVAMVRDIPEIIEALYEAIDIIRQEDDYRKSQGHACPTCHAHLPDGGHETDCPRGRLLAITPDKP